VIAAIVVVWAMGMLVRSDLVVRPIVERQLASVETEHGLRIEVGRIAPRGFASVRLSDIPVHADSGDLLAHVSPLDAHPDISAILALCPMPDRIHIEALALDLLAVAGQRAPPDGAAGDAGGA